VDVLPRIGSASMLGLLIVRIASALIAGKCSATVPPAGRVPLSADCGFLWFLYHGRGVGICWG